jgi:hypothetical protein
VTIARPLIAAALAGVLAFAYWTDKTRLEERYRLQVAAERVLVQDVATVTRVSITHGGREVVLQKDGERWHMTAPEQIRADRRQVETLLENIRGAKRTNRFVPQDAAAYGLAPPVSTVRLGFAGGEEWTLDLGTDGQLGRVYARVRGDTEAFNLGDWVARSARRGVDEWRDRSLTAGIPADAQAISVESPAGAFSLERGLGRWTLRIGDVAVPADTAKVDRMLDSLGNGRLLKVIDEPTSTPLQLGLEPPRLRITVDGKPLLAAGTRVNVPEPSLVIGLEGKRIGFAPVSLFSDFLMPPWQWSTKRVVWALPEDVATIESKSGNQHVQLRREEGRWIFADTPDVAVNQARVASFLRGVTSLRTTQFAGPPDLDAAALRKAGLHQPAMTIRLTTFDGATHGLDMGVTDTSAGATYVRRVGDGTVWTIDFEDVASITTFRSNLIERRLMPDVGATARAIVLTLGRDRVRFERTGSAWRVLFGDGGTALLPPNVLEAFFAAADEFEYDAEFLGTPGGESAAEFEFFAEGAAAPFCSLRLVSQNAATGETTVVTQRGAFSVSREEMAPFDRAVSILVEAALRDRVAREHKK